MENALRDYLNYLRLVLGVERFIRPLAVEETLATLSSMFRTRTGHWPEEKDFDVLFISADPESSLFSGETGELFEKMKSAMKVSHLRILELDLLHLEAHWQKAIEDFLVAKQIIVFSENVAVPREVSDGPFRFLPSLRGMLADPGLKRPAWEALKVVMKELGVGP
ncbi:MAG: hypothetical protein N2578_03510 [Bdellovibrionaceae bacterium]|nr:hypothetical protein [Pseudobdellovibrionaceae bacterium]